MSKKHSKKTSDTKKGLSFNMRARILIVEDEFSIVENISYALDTDGFECVCAVTLGEARQAIESQAFDLIILDVGLPDGSGFDFCGEVRRKSRIPIVFLTARADEIDRVVGLEIGGDDYVVKPFSPRELSARVKAILRRSADSSQAPVKTASEPMRDPCALEIDDERKRVLFRGKALDLSRNEYRLLCVLIRRPGRVFSRDDLLNQAWEEPDASMDRTVDAHIKKLRAKLREIEPHVEAILTHRGMGYSLNENLK